MTISSTTRIAGPFIGNGTASVFPFTFKVFAAADLDVVRLNTSTGIETTLVLNSDYSVTLNGDQNTNPGGNITLLAGALATGYTLVITSDIANLQPTDLTNQGGFYPEVITDALDRATIQIQQISDIGDRTLKIPITDGSLNMELPTAAQRANSFLSFDANGLPSVVTAGSSGAPATITRQVFSGTGSQTVFTLASDPGALGNSAQVYIGGVYQQRSTYTIAGTTLTFSQAPVAGTDNIEFVNFLTSNIGSTSADLVTYTPPGTGAVARSAASKFGDVVSVKDFGAVGNGVTNDTVAIQAALNSGATGIYVPKGVYVIGSQLTVPANITLHGDGAGSEFTMLSSLDTMFSITGDNVHFKDLAFRGTDTEISASANERIIVAMQRTNVTVTGCELMETIIAVQYQECDSCSMSGCYIHNIRHRVDLSQGYGLLCNTDNENLIICDNRFEDIGRHAIYVSSGSSNVSISGNVINVCESIAIAVNVTSAQNTSRNISIVGNTVTAVAGAVSPSGIGLFGNVESAVISGNCLYDMADDGIVVEGNSSDAQADNPRQITIVGNSIRDANRDGIRTINASELAITGNMCGSCATGIRVSSSSSGIGALFSNATVAGNQCIASSSYGLNISGTASCTGIELSGNTIRGSAIRDYQLPNISGASLLPTQIRFGDAAEQYLFTAGSVAAGVTDQVMDAPISGLAAYTTQGKRYALSLSARISSAITAGTATVTLFKGASAQTAYNVVLDASNQSAVNVQGIRQTFSTTDNIVVKVTTSGSFAVASTSNIQAIVRLVDLAD